MCIRDRYDIVPEILIPLVGEVKELKFVKDIVVRTAEEVMDEKGVKLNYHVGTMIEIPRAAITADEIACLLYTSYSRRNIRNIINSINIYYI